MPRYKSVGLRRLKVLKVAWKRRNIRLALRAVGLGRVVTGIPRLHIPQTTTARAQGAYIPPLVTRAPVRKKPSTKRGRFT